MAKLSARDRKEVLRVWKTTDGDPEPDRLVVWRRYTRAFMTDGTVLSKVDVRFAPSAYEPKERAHSYGWKKEGKIRAGLTFAEIRTAYKEKGWTVAVDNIGQPIYTTRGTVVLQ